MTMTAYERLQGILTELEDMGIDARGPSECCSTCSAHAVPDGTAYVFWNEQSHTSAFAANDEGVMVAGGDLIGDLYLGYGGADGTAEAASQVAQRVASLARAAGLEAVWDGNPGHTLRIKAEREPTEAEAHIANRDISCEGCGTWMSLGVDIAAWIDDDKGLCAACAPAFPHAQRTDR